MAINQEMVDIIVEQLSVEKDKVVFKIKTMTPFGSYFKFLFYPQGSSR